LGRKVQVPFAVAPSAAEQTSQLPPQAVLQQTPSAQVPETHSYPKVQVAPFESMGVQALSLQ
jgi:hypothetical protein